MATSPKPDRARTVALSALVLCCVGFVGSLIYLQKRVATSVVVGIRKPPDPELVAETEARKREKILDLRDKWQVWAKAHQPQLKAMLRAQPGDLATLTAVTDALPSRPKKETCGITVDDLSGIANYTDPVVVRASWYHQGDDMMLANAETAKEWKKDEQRSQMRERASFDLLRDVMVTSTSSSWSKKNYCLYASGRVLECQQEIPGLKQPFVEIAPSYSFLTSEK